MVDQRRTRRRPRHAAGSRVARRRSPAECDALPRRAPPGAIPPPAAASRSHARRRSAPCALGVSIVSASSLRSCSRDRKTRGPDGAEEAEAAETISNAEIAGIAETLPGIFLAFSLRSAFPIVCVSSIQRHCRCSLAGCDPQMAQAVLASFAPRGGPRRRSARVFRP
jgi:hypothetical protein